MTLKMLSLQLLLIVFLLHATNSYMRSVMSNCYRYLQNMVMAHQKGDTSLAYSIALKVHFAAQMLHYQMGFESEDRAKTTAWSLQSKLAMRQYASLSDNPCSQLLADIVKMASQPRWLENFQSIDAKIGIMQAQCTNADFQSVSADYVDGFDDKCALCVVILRIMENYIGYHKVDVARFVSQDFCDLFDGVLKPTCLAFVHFAGPVIVQTLVNKYPSDTVCLKIGYCTDPKCRIVSQLATELGIDIAYTADYIIFKANTYSSKAIAPTTTAPAPWYWLLHIFVDKFGNGHLPAFDLDNDSYSDVSTFRGYNWRGSDCNELDAKIYPGRRNGSKLIDHDCNGIFGLDNRGRLYEDKFCGEYRRIGVAVIGDSAGAYFSIPYKYFNASQIKKGTYDDFLIRAADYLDLPHESGYTGHTNTTYPSHSFYKYLREWNLCNHNDFQNIGVNGGDAGNTWGNIQALRRNQKYDNPLIMFLELIGNDVCKKSFDSMTKPEYFKKSIIKLLRYLDETVPAGSHLLVFGLGDGDLLYENLHDDIHPLNVTYRTVYDFLNCLKISPCWGWLNSNDTVRKFTTERAKNLSKMYQEIIDDGTVFHNFDMVYYEFPAIEILARKVMEGGDPKEMIYRCDGFHPNGQFHSYLADWLWYTVQTKHPEWIGKRNIHNEEIRNMFGHYILH